MTDDRYTEQTVELVAKAVRDADPEGWLTGPGGTLAPYYTAAAQKILTALADAGLLLPPGHFAMRHMTAEDEAKEDW